MAPDKFAILRAAAERRAGLRPGNTDIPPTPHQTPARVDPERAIPLCTVLSEDPDADLQHRRRPPGVVVASPSRVPEKRGRQDRGGSPRSSKRGRHEKDGSKRRRSSNTVIDNDFLKKNLEEYRTDPVEAAIKLFRHLADVSKLQTEEAEARTRGALKERDEERSKREEERKKYESLSSTLAKAQRDLSDLRRERKDLEAERDAASSRAKDFELQITELKGKEAQAESLATRLQERVSELESEVGKLKAENSSDARVAELEERLKQAEEKIDQTVVECGDIAAMALGMAGEGFDKALAQIAIVHPSLSLDREVLNVDFDVEEGKIVKRGSSGQESAIIYPRASDT